MVNFNSFLFVYQRVNHDEMPKHLPFWMLTRTSLGLSSLAMGALGAVGVAGVAARACLGQQKDEGFHGIGWV